MFLRKESTHSSIIIAFLHIHQIRKELSVLAKLLPKSWVIVSGKTWAVCLVLLAVEKRQVSHHHSTRGRSNSESCSFCPSKSHKPDFSIQVYKIKSLISGLYSGGLHQSQHHPSDPSFAVCVSVCLSFPCNPSQVFRTKPCRM